MSLSSSANNAVVSEYTESVEEQHAYVKETVDTIFPSNIRILQVRLPARWRFPHSNWLTWRGTCPVQGVLDRVRQKIQKLEKALQAQREDCKEPCKTRCPVPVVSGEWSAPCSCGDVTGEVR